MTDLERWRLERAELDRKIRKAEAAEAESRIREALADLAANQDLPVLELIDKALRSVPLNERDRAAQFIERLTVLVRAGRDGVAR